mgnify:CR=1 FL=1
MLNVQADCAIHEVKKVTIWGNHSSTQFPDLYHATVKGLSIIYLLSNK